MTKKRWLAVVLMLCLVVGVGLIVWEPVQEVSKGRQAQTAGKLLIKRLKRGNLQNAQKHHPIGEKVGSVTTRNGSGQDEVPTTALSIPRVDINLPVYKTPGGLPYGAYAELASVKPNTAPGDANYVLAGHSSYLHGVLFANLFQLTTSQGYVHHPGGPDRAADYQGGTGEGGLIIVYTQYGKYTYQADSAYTVNGHDDSILNGPPAGSAKQIHLFTCPRTGHKHPPFRYVVQGHLIRVQLNRNGRQKHLDTSLMTS